MGADASEQLLSTLYVSDFLTQFGRPLGVRPLSFSELDGLLFGDGTLKVAVPRGPRPSTRPFGRARNGMWRRLFQRACGGCWPGTGRSTFGAWMRSAPSFRGGRVDGSVAVCPGGLQGPHSFLDRGCNRTAWSQQDCVVTMGSCSTVTTGPNGLNRVLFCAAARGGIRLLCERPASFAATPLRMRSVCLPRRGRTPAGTCCTTPSSASWSC
jgi:hypothetical protein